MSVSRFTALEHCLACGGSELVPYLDLGVQPLANGFHDGSKVLPAYPLGLNVCPTCFHSQNVGAVDPAVLFTDYPYVSGTSETLRDYFFQFVKRVELDFDMRYSGSVLHPTPKRSLRVLDIASNDGSLLSQFRKRGHQVLGIDPAENLYEAQALNGVRTIIGFWDETTVDSVKHNSVAPDEAQFDVIVAMNVLGHVQDPLKFLQLAKSVLAPGGRIYVQTSQADMVNNCEFDTCYHEHLSFFTARSFRALAMRAGLWIDKHEIVPIHGGSHLVCMRVPDEGSNTFVAHVEGREEEDGLYNIGTYARFQARAEQIRQRAYGVMGWHQQDFGTRMVGYGAAAKAMTFFNFSGAGDWLDYIVDDNPLKIGKICPVGGIELPVVGSATLAAEQESLAIVITAWNFREEIIAKVKRMRPGRDDTFITYFPNITIS